MDTIRVLRIIEYTGPREQVEKQVAQSIHGERKVHQMTIRAATIGLYPEVLEPKAYSGRDPHTHPYYQSLSDQALSDQS